MAGEGAKVKRLRWLSAGLGRAAGAGLRLPRVHRSIPGSRGSAGGWGCCSSSGMGKVSEWWKRAGVEFEIPLGRGVVGLLLSASLSEQERIFGGSLGRQRASVCTGSSTNWGFVWMR